MKAANPTSHPSRARHHTTALAFAAIAFVCLLLIILQPVDKSSVARELKVPTQGTNGTDRSISLGTDASLLQLNSTRVDVNLADALACFNVGRKHNVMYYYSASKSKCLPYPNDFSTRPETRYRHPADATLTTITATIDADFSGPEGNFRTFNTSETDSVVEKFSPSLYSRWLFESWRLWEAEIAIGESSPQNSTSSFSKSESAQNDPNQLSEFATSGHHNHSLPNSMYDLKNFCVDELLGTLVGFDNPSLSDAQRAAYPLHLGMDVILARTEDAVKFKSRFATYEQFFHDTNREAIALVQPAQGQSTWKSVLSASIEQHHKTSTASQRQLPPEVLFVEEPAIVLPTIGSEMNNPGHQFHRVGSYMALAKMMNAQTILFLTDIIAHEPVNFIYQTKRHVYGLDAKDELLIPEYLLTTNEHSKANATTDPLNTASPATSVSSEELIAVTSWKTRTDFHPFIDTLAAADAQGKLAQPFPFESQFRPLLSTGEDGCENYKCSPTSDRSPVEMRRKCGRTYAIVNIARQASHGVLADNRPYQADTQNYTTTAWGLAVRETMIEAKRLRRKVWSLTNKKITINKSAALESIIEGESRATYTYLRSWRERLVSQLTNSRQTVTSRSGPSFSQKFLDYFREFFAYRLEDHHYRGLLADEEKQSKLPRRQLICYKRAAFGHVFYNKYDKYPPPGSIGLSSTANCNLKDTMRIVYETVWSQYGMCMKFDQPLVDQVEPQKDDERDAHPIFLLNATQREELQTAFKTAESEMNEALSKNAGGSELEIEIEVIQNRYDTKFMAYFEGTNSTRTRPIRVFVAYRSAKRVLTNWRFYLSALLNSHFRNFVEFEFEEGLDGGAYSPDDPHYSLDEPLNTARARQYHAYLSADLFIGPHGADMHSSAFIKPSGLTTEFGSDWYDNLNTDDYKGGLFSAFAFGRNVGFLKVLISRKWMWNTERREPWEGDHHTFMTLPDLRHVISLSVCSWLAMNSVRLESKFNSAFILPWWCRGGSRAIIESANQRTPKLPGLSNDDNAFYESRLANRFGFSNPVCRPLQAAVEKNGNTMHLSSLAVNQWQLNQLQECAKATTYVSYGNSETLTLRRHVEGLQSLLEGILFIDHRKAQRIARLIVGGSYRFTSTLDDAPKASGKDVVCGNNRLPNDVLERESCLLALLSHLVVDGISVANVSEVGAPNISKHFQNYVESHQNLFAVHIPPVSSSFKEEIIKYIVNKNFVSTEPSIRLSAMTLMEGAEFSYGWQCQNQKSKRKKRRK